MSRDYTKKKDKVILCGKGVDWWKAPEISRDAEIWGINDVIMSRVNFDLLFNIHLTEDYCSLDMNCTQLASSLGIPIIMPREYEELPTSIRFPLEEIMKEFDTDYFMTGIVYMIAYAVYKSYKQIDCYGINMRGADEKYKNARACVEYWLGIAKGRGIKVNMYGKYCDCLKTFDRRLYGFNDFQTMPEDINDRALYVSFGASLDRTVIDKFHKLLSVQKDSKYFNNYRPLPLNDPNDNVMFNNLHDIVYMHGDGTKYVGDIGFYNLMHIDKLINNEHSAKIVCLVGDEEASFKDWMEFAKDINPWTNPKCEYWNGDKSSELAYYFPKYDLPKEEALRKFINEYYMIAKRCQYKYPGYVKVYPANLLETEEGKTEILTFLGHKAEDLVLEIPDKPMPIPPPLAAQKNLVK